MAQTVSRPARDGWEPVLAAALLGAERAPPAAPGDLGDLVDAEDSGGALLARLAAHGALHRAGTGLGPEALAAIAPRDAFGPECPPAAAARLRDLLAGGPVLRRRLEEWCALAAASGMRAPAALLPALRAHHDTLRAAIDRVAGPELDWLAGACGESPRGTNEGPGDWTGGTLPERRAAFAAFRARDPVAARAALEVRFHEEKADLREALVDGLATGLSEADAPFLECCLDDRAGGVRLAAQRLLPHLPGSPYAVRMAERARAALTIESRRRLLGGTTHSLAVTLPEESPDLARDGVEPKAGEVRGGEAQGGPRAVLLRDILARAPLDAFAEHPPALWIGLALASAWSDAVLHGLHAGIRRTRDPAWTRALADVLIEAHAGTIEGVRRGPEHLGLCAQALELLPEAAWEARVAALIEARRVAVLPALLDRGPEAFSEPFSVTLLDWLARVSRESADVGEVLVKGRIVERLAERLWPDAENVAAVIPARLGEEANGRLYDQLTALAETLAARAAMRRDFASWTTRAPLTATGETTAG